MIVSKETIDKIKESNDIGDVASEFFELEKTTDGYRTFCIHGGERDTPSLHIYPKTQTFFCFGCRAGSTGSATNSSDIISFVRWVKNWDFMQAIEWLANRANIPLEEKDMSLEQRTNLMLYQNMEKTIKNFENNLENNLEVKKYLYGRGLNDEDIKKWRIGSSKNLPVYTITNIFNQPIAYSIREGSLHAKYRNSVKSPIWQKTNTLFGLYYAKQLIREKDFVVIVEGYNDAILLQKYGVPAVSIMGINFTEIQAKILLKYTKNLILFYDGDAAGINQTSLQINSLLNFGFENIYVLNIFGMDPDELALEYKEKTLHYIDQVKTDFFVYLLNKELAILRQQIFQARKNANLKIQSIINLVKDENTKKIYEDEAIQKIMEETKSD